ncbi:hypothetical protein TYRP_004377 [Tyrophagus putrescentiae]|nr:hypothetical protein TYRP_004377 [Tyrophagus putrescentiae]
MPSYFIGAYSNINKKNKAKTNQSSSIVNTKAKEDHFVSPVDAAEEDKLIQVDQAKMEENGSTSPSNDPKPAMTELSPGQMTIQVIDAPLQMEDSEMAQLLSADEQFNVSTSIFLTNKQSIFSSESEILKTVLENYMTEAKKQTEKILFSFCVVTFTQIHDLLNVNKVTEPANYRQVISVEHVLDLVNLGTLTKKSCQEEKWFMGGPFNVCHFYWKTGNADASKHFFLIEGCFTQEDSLVAALSTIQEIEGCVRARQRNGLSATIASGNSLANFLEPAFTAEKSKMTLHPDLESVYLYLLNNVSVLEHDLLEAHKRYNEASHSQLALKSSEFVLDAQFYPED